GHLLLRRRTAGLRRQLRRLGENGLRDGQRAVLDRKEALRRAARGCTADRRLRVPRKRRGHTGDLRAFRPRAPERLPARRAVGGHEAQPESTGHEPQEVAEAQESRRQESGAQGQRPPLSASDAARLRGASRAAGPYVPGASACGARDTPRALRLAGAPAWLSTAPTRQPP